MMNTEAEEDSLFDDSNTVSPESYSFGIFTFRRIWQILKIIFSKRLCLLFLVLVCVMALLEQYLVYNVGIIPSGFYKVLGDKNLSAFWVQLIKAVLLILAICFVISCKKYILNILYVTSREVLTDKLHAMYFCRNKFYVLNTFQYTSTDNPDQRITQDIDKFCKQFNSVLGPFVIAPFTISYYSYNCYQTTGWIGPVGVFGVFIISAIINKFLMKPIMGFVIKQEKCEGYFRFKHMHVRTNAESIAFQDANIAEMSHADHKLLDLIKIQQMLYLREFPLDIVVNTFSYMGSIISYLILAYPIFSGKYDNLTPSELSELISKNAFVAIYLMSCFSSLINISTNISELAGLTHRVCELLDTLKNNDDKSKDDSFTSCRIQLSNRNSWDDDDPVIELKNVSFSAPKESTPLVNDISLKIKVGNNLLVTGKSSSGKTSLFRVIKDLWPIQEGLITRRWPFGDPSLMFFLPQHPLLSDGSLLEQIVFPLDLPKNIKPKDKDINLIISYIKFVDLDNLLEKVGLFDQVDWNWYDVLSPGEAQRLSFVRLYCHKPKIAFLDEATSAVSIELEEKMYKKCTELGITLVSIGHRTSLVQFHNNFLHLDGEGGWKLSAESQGN